MRAKGEQASLVFSGVFCIVWIGEAVVTLQIKLLGGNMYVRWLYSFAADPIANLLAKLFLPIHLHHRLHPLPARHRGTAKRPGTSRHRPYTRLPRADCVVSGRRRQYTRRLWSGPESGRHCCVSVVRLLRRHRVPVLHQLIAISDLSMPA